MGLSLHLLYVLSFKLFGFAGTEIISGAYEVCPIRVDCGVELHILEHVEHLSCMATTSKDHQEVGRRPLLTAFWGNGILGDHEGEE